MAGARLASRPNKWAPGSVPGETPRIPPQPRRPRAGHRDRSTASIDHRHRKIPPAFASNHLRSIRHYGIRMESERPRIGEVLRSIQLCSSNRILSALDADRPIVEELILGLLRFSKCFPVTPCDVTGKASIAFTNIGLGRAP